MSTACLPVTQAVSVHLVKKIRAFGPKAGQRSNIQYLDTSRKSECTIWLDRSAARTICLPGISLWSLKICMWEVPPKPKASAVTRAKIMKSCLLIVSWRRSLREVTCTHQVKVVCNTCRMPNLQCHFMSLQSFSFSVHVCNWENGGTCATLKKLLSCLAKACHKSAGQANDCNNLSAKDKSMHSVPRKNTPNHHQGRFPESQSLV